MLDESIVPLCVVGALLAVAASFTRKWWTGALLALAMPVIASYGWYWLNATPGGEPEHPWDLMATAYWALYVVPISYAVFLVARKVRALVIANAG